LRLRTRSSSRAARGARGQAQCRLLTPHACPQAPTPGRQVCQLTRQGCRYRPADAVSLRCGENDEGNCCPMEMKQAAAAGGNILVGTYWLWRVTGAEEVAECVVAFTERLGRGEVLEAAHTLCAAFHTPMILSQSIVPVGAGPMHEPTAKGRAHRLG
jgi:hypothetical protein